MGNTYALIPTYGDVAKLSFCLHRLSATVGCKEVTPLILYEDKEVGMATGFTAAANILLRSALADPYLHGVYLLSDDVDIMTEDFHHKILRYHKDNPDVGAIMPMELLPGAKETLLPCGGGARPLTSTADEEVVYPMLAFAWVGAEALRKVGILDEQFSPGVADDFDLGVRLWLAGYRVIWTPSIQFRHWDRGQTMAKAHTIDTNRNLDRLYAKYPYLHFGQDTGEIIRILKEKAKDGKPNSN